MILVKLAKWADWSLFAVGRTILCVSSLLITILMVTEVVARYIFSISVIGLEEVMLLTVFWLYMMGAVMGTRERSHIRVDIVRLLVKDPQKVDVTKALSALISLIMTGFMIYWSYDLFSWAIERGQTTPALVLPYAISQCTFFVAGILIAVYLLYELVDNIRAVIGHKACIGKGLG